MDWAAATYQRFRRIAIAECKGGQQRRGPKARSDWCDRSAIVDESIYEGNLQAGLGGMATRNEQGKRSMLAAIHIRERVRIGAGIKQHLCDLDCVGRRHLTIALDTVRANVVQQGGAMYGRVERCYPCRARVDDLGVISEQAFQHGSVAMNDSFNRGFELFYRRALVCDGVDPLTECRPIAKVVPAGYR